MMSSWAVLSDDGRYRYRLGRLWRESGLILPFVMLNPSTADAEQDDPTIRRCIGFAEKLGYAGLVVVNLYAFRATDPRVLWQVDDPVGPDNDRHLFDVMESRRIVIAAWGGNAKPDRVDVTVRMATAAGANLCALGETKDGHPRHPLYLKKTARPEPWAPRCPQEETP